MGTEHLIKICGIQDIETLAVCQDLGVDLVGLNFSPVSPRKIDFKTAETLCNKAKSSNTSPKIVFLFYKNSENEISDLLKKLPSDFVQFIEGDLSTDFISAIKSKVTLLPAFRIESPVFHLSYPECPLVILDSFHRDSGGGTGKTFPWEFVKEVKRPYLLAGGIHSGNVQLALQTLHPRGIDVASGVETDGKKDPKKIRALVQNVRSL